MFPQELAQKIKGYQSRSPLELRQDADQSQARHHAADGTRGGGLAEGTEALAGELLPATSAHPSVVMVSKGQGRLAKGCLPTASWLVA